MTPRRLVGTIQLLVGSFLRQLFITNIRLPDVPLCANDCDAPERILHHAPLPHRRTATSRARRITWRLTKLIAASRTPLPPPIAPSKRPVPPAGARGGGGAYISYRDGRCAQCGPMRCRPVASHHARHFRGHALSAPHTKRALNKHSGLAFRGRSPNSEDERAGHATAVRIHRSQMGRDGGCRMAFRMLIELWFLGRSMATSLREYLCLVDGYELIRSACSMCVCYGSTGRGTRTRHAVLLPALL